MVLEIFLM